MERRREEERERDRYASNKSARKIERRGNEARLVHQVEGIKRI